MILGAIWGGGQVSGKPQEAWKEPIPSLAVMMNAASPEHSAFHLISACN